MANIIEINSRDLYRNNDTIKYCMEKDGFIKIIFDDEPIFAHVMEGAREFFNLSLGEKNTMMRNSIETNPNQNMYYGYFPSNLNGKEGLDIPNPNMKNDADKYILCENISYPESFTKGDIVDKYVIFSHILGMDILRILLGDEMADDLCANNTHLSVLRLNYYPSHKKDDDCVETSNGVKLACDTHVDDSLLTLLYQDNTSGLQIEDPYTGKWTDVPPSSNSILINSGKLLNMVSNGKYNPINHRVLQNYEERISIPYFMCARPDVYINEEYKTYHDYMKNFKQKKEYIHINDLLEKLNI